MRRSEIKQLKEKVLRVLHEYPRGRDSDQWLTLKIWDLYYPSRVKEMEEKLPDGTISKRKYVFLRDIMDLPREDNVKRIRAKIQNEEHKYMPTSLEVAKQRRIREEDWKAWSQNQSSML